MTRQLYSYWRSQAAYRVRIALHLKGLDAEVVPVDIVGGDQHSDAYAALNPNRAVPTLVDDDVTLVQSLAIIEYLDERHPDPPLLPGDPLGRARVRALALTLAADAHPFVVPRVRRYLSRELGLDEAAVMRWLLHWMEQGLTAFEAQLAGDARAGRCCHGDAATIADLCLVPHVTSLAVAPGFDLARFPIAKRVYDTCMATPAFTETHPSRQPGAP